jgi:tetratricopeptide (TPR) repeat protein
MSPGPWEGTVPPTEAELDAAGERIDDLLTTAGESTGDEREAATAAARRLVGDVFGPEAWEAASVEVAIARLRVSSGRFCDARGHVERALVILREPIHRDLAELRLAALRLQGEVECRVGSRARAVEIVRGALALARAHWADGDARVLDAEMALGVACKLAGRHVEAGEIYSGLALRTRQLAPETRASLAHNLAGLAHAEGDLERAELHARDALELRTAVHAEASLEVQLERCQLATILGEMGRFEEAEALHRTTLAHFVGVLGEDHYEVAHVHHELGALAHDRGQLDEALRHFRVALETKQRSIGADHGDTAITMAAIARVELQRGDHDAGLARLARAYPLLLRDLGEIHPATVAVREELGAVAAQFRCDPS